MSLELVDSGKPCSTSSRQWLVPNKSRLDLLDHSDALAENRDDIERVRKDELDDTPVWMGHALGELRLLDSFMRETHRMHPFVEGRSATSALPSPQDTPRPSTSWTYPLAVTMQRKVLVPYNFEDGPTVPPGPSVNLTSLQHSLDADILGPDTDTFGYSDGKRYMMRMSDMAMPVMFEE